jgi:hypothetical protein
MSMLMATLIILFLTAVTIALRAKSLGREGQPVATTFMVPCRARTEIREHGSGIKCGHFMIDRKQNKECNLQDHSIHEFDQDW